MSEGACLLVVDDELSMRRMLRSTLGAAGYRVEEAADGREGLLKNSLQKPDLILLDLGLPDQSGLEVLQKIREFSTVPILVLTAEQAEGEKVKALDLGADDYVTKPFGMAELMARIRAALRHARPHDASPVLQFGALTLDLEHRLVLVQEKPLKLTTTEYALLKLLASHAGKVMTHRQMLREIWGPACVEETHYLRVYIGSLRKKIEDAGGPALIQTEPGVGYRLVLPREMLTGD